MGCLKLTYNQNTELKIVYRKKELSSKISVEKVCSSYELKDHLGNVRAVVSDLRSNINDVLQAKLLSSNTYYPFGMLMPGRNTASDAYRYGFNGKEMDNDMSGGKTGAVYDYGFRVYDSRIAKFLSVDPLTKSYPWYTPYQFAGNMPIWAIDLDGLEPLIRNLGSGYQYMNSDKTGDQIATLGGFVPFGSLADPIAGTIMGMQRITEDDVEKFVRYGSITANTVTDVIDVLKVGGKVGSTVASIVGAVINIYGTIDYYKNQFPNWEINEIIDKEFGIMGTTKDEVVEEYIEARTLIQGLVKSGDIKYEYQEIAGVDFLEYTISEKAKEVVSELAQKHHLDNYKDFWASGDKEKLNKKESSGENSQIHPNSPSRRKPPKKRNKNNTTERRIGGL